MRRAPTFVQKIKLTRARRSNNDATVAQSWRVRGTSSRKPRPALDSEALQRLALHYVGRYATTRARLHAYLDRKIAERGWAEEGDPDTGAIVARFAELGYVDDRGFALARAASLQRRGYGERRIAPSLRAAGLAESDIAEARASTVPGALRAALDFACRRHIGPFAREIVDRAARERALAVMIRAGHGFDLARQIVDSEPGCVPEQDDWDGAEINVSN